jgi:hypothetical protein
VDEPRSFYDEATRRRIDGGGAVAGRPQAPARARFAGSVALMTAVGLGLQEVVDPPKDDEIVLEVDTAGEGRDDDPVTVDYDPTSVQRSRAHVRSWRFAGQS